MLETFRVSPQQYLAITLSQRVAARENTNFNEPLQ